jgi:hypothetical protein
MAEDVGTMSVYFSEKYQAQTSNFSNKETVKSPCWKPLQTSLDDQTQDFGTQDTLMSALFHRVLFT